MGILDSGDDASLKSSFRPEVILSDPKRGGSRDISELKQRLGLKKGGAGATAANQPRGNGATGGVVPPPGLNLPSAPPQPVIPNAADVKLIRNPEWYGIWIRRFLDMRDRSVEDIVNSKVDEKFELQM